MSHAANVTICVMKSDGSPLSGVAATYYATYGYSMGSTDASGYVTQAIANGTYNFKVSYRGTEKMISATVSGNDTLRFYTTAVTAKVASCSGTNISGATVKYQPASSSYQYWVGGSTNASGETMDQLFPGTCDFTAIYAGTQATQTGVVVGGDGQTAGATSLVTFTPTTLVLGNAGSKTYKSGPYSYYANGTVYLFPGTYEFTFPGGYKTNLTISGCSQNLTVNILVLKDHNNNPLQGGTARGGNGASYSGWFVSGATDVNGVLFDVRSNAPATMSYEMKFNNTTSVLTQNVTANNVFNFKTNRLTLKIQTCSGDPLAGGTARYGAGSSYSTYFFPAPNNTDANGQTSAEFFPGTYSFEMGINSTTQVKSSVVLPNADTTLIWQTTKVTLNWPYDIAYGGSGDSRYFNKPSMELLPGTVNFNFRGPAGYNYTAITISGCSLTLTPGIVRLVNAANAPLSGGVVDGYQGGWSNYGTTGANGNLLVLGKNPSSLRMTYNSGSQQMNGINFSVNPIVTFQTKVVTMELKDASGGHSLEGDNLMYYAGGWHIFGSGVTTGGTETMELLPGSYSFKMGYGGGSQQISNQNIGINPLVTFQTTVVTMELKDASGGHSLEGDNLMYYAGGWHTFGSGTTTGGTETMELLPLSYSFKMGYGGGSQQISNQNVGTNPLVTFQTILVTMELKDASCGHSLEGNSLMYYAGGWHTFGSGATTSGTETMELLPLSYSFKLGYGGASQQISNQNVATNPLVSYHTVVVTLTLKDPSSNPISGGVGTYYAGGWNAFGVTDASGQVSKELLPVTYSYKMAYASKSNQKSNILAPSVVNFIYDGSSIYKMSNGGDGEEGGVATRVSATAFEVYPNPARDVLYVNFNSSADVNATIKLVDMTGKVVVNNEYSAIQGANKCTVNVGELPSGTYMLMMDNIDSKILKIVVQR
ncbi:MAG: T9SS type A sorting domain-containing protein [Bacteroidetes bacterium]|nr:T9SS type A sorting domain-containing protein [Bacteroidota bacterium]